MDNLASLFSDKAKYPDDLTIEIQGERITMKEWRDGLGLKNEFHAHNEKQSARQRQLEQIVQERERQVQQMQGQLAQAMARQGVNPQHAQDDDLSAYRQDPAFGPLVKLIEQQQGTIGQLAQRMQMDEVAWNSHRYQQQLDEIRKDDQDADPQAIARYTQEIWQKGPDVKLAHRLMTEEKRTKKAVEDAEKRGYDRARAEPPMPPQPRGRGGATGHGQPELPKTADWRPDMDARMRLAAQEFGPAIQEALQNQ